MRIIGISSGGGHLTELLVISRNMPEMTAIITETSAVYRNPRSDIAFFPIQDPHRSPALFIKNTFQAARYLISLKSDVVVSTGAGISVPFFLLARLLGRKCIFVESGARIRTPSLTGRILYPMSHLFIVQSEELLSFYKNAKVARIVPFRETENDLGAVWY